MSLQSRKNVALEDPGAELVDRLTALGERYGRIALVVVGAIVLLGVGTYFTLQARQRQEEAASEKLAQVSNLFWQGDYDRSRQAAQDLARQYGGTRSGIDALRISGDDAFWRGRWKDAIADYRAYLAKHDSGVLADAVRRSLAYSLESDGQVAEAAKLYDQLVGVFDRESSGEMLMASARCYRALGQNELAKQRLQRLIDEFGDSSEQLRARIMLAELSAPVTP